MDRDLDYTPYNVGFENDPLFNPSAQYEQAYLYYRYLTQQVEYKIKCKEYDKLIKHDKIS